MRMRWLTTAILPLAAAGALVACSGGGDRDKPVIHGEHPEAESYHSIALLGCLQPGDAAGQYRLRHVRLAPRGEQPSSDTSAQNAVITEGSWVRLTASDEDGLRSHLGQEVQVVGTITDTGRNTIGTTGYQKGAGQPESRTDKSRQAADESYAQKMAEEAGPLGEQSTWNGYGPEVAVERIQPTGQACGTESPTGK